MLHIATWLYVYMSTTTMRTMLHSGQMDITSQHTHTHSTLSVLRGVTDKLVTLGSGACCIHYKYTQGKEGA